MARSPFRRSSPARTLADTVRKLALLDLTHNLRDLCTILNSFPGSMQMLPSPLQMPEMARDV